MPAAYIHENITKKALEEIKNPPEYITQNIYPYELGAQGPDILFYYNILKFWDKDYTPNELGNDMHNKKVNDFFRAALIKAKESGGAARAWVTGFVTHYAADTTIHPFVYATTDNEDGSRNITEHLALEATLDTWYYKERQGKKGIPRQAICAKMMTDSQKEQVAKVLSLACAEVYPEKKLTKAQAYKTIGDVNSVISALYSPHKVKHAFFRLIEKIIGKPKVITRHAPTQSLPIDDFLNSSKNTWENPWDRSLKYDYSFPELFDMAVKKASEYAQTVIGYYNDSITLDEALKTFGDKSYASGLPVKK